MRSIIIAMISGNDTSACDLLSATITESTPLIYGRYSEQYIHYNNGSHHRYLIIGRRNMRSIYELSNKEWQKYFEALRAVTEPSSEKKMKGGKGALTVNYRSIQSSDNFCGDTTYYYYVQGINSILKAIRSGESDYCWSLNQIKDLLKYEHDRLQTEWKPEDKYFRVWLN